jgi:hypothetical protein
MADAEKKAELQVQLAQLEKAKLLLQAAVSDLERHKSRAAEQRAKYKAAIANVTKTQVVIVMDYKENIKYGMHACATGTEYFEQQARTILGFTVFYREDDNIKKEHFDIISEVLSHDSFFSQIALYKVLEHSRMKKIRQNCTNLILFTDCGPHFRSYEMMYAVLVETFNKNYFDEVDWHFFAESHGKNCCDAHFSVLSGILSDLKKSRTMKVHSTQDLIDFFTERVKVASSVEVHFLELTLSEFTRGTIKQLQFVNNQHMICGELVHQSEASSALLSQKLDAEFAVPTIGIKQLLYLRRTKKTHEKDLESNQHAVDTKKKGKIVNITMKVSIGSMIEPVEVQGKVKTIQDNRKTSVVVKNSNKEGIPVLPIDLNAREEVYLLHKHGAVYLVVGKGVWEGESKHNEKSYHKVRLTEWYQEAYFHMNNIPEVKHKKDGSLVWWEYSVGCHVSKVHPLISEETAPISNVQPSTNEVLSEKAKSIKLQHSALSSVQKPKKAQNNQAKKKRLSETQQQELLLVVNAQRAKEQSTPPEQPKKQKMPKRRQKPSNIGDEANPLEIDKEATKKRKREDSCDIDPEQTKRKKQKVPESIDLTTPIALSTRSHKKKISDTVVQPTRLSMPTNLELAIEQMLTKFTQPNSAAPLGTSATPLGTSAAPLGASATPFGTSAVQVGTSATQASLDMMDIDIAIDEIDTLIRQMCL